MHMPLITRPRTLAATLAVLALVAAGCGSSAAPPAPTLAPAPTPASTSQSPTTAPTQPGVAATAAPTEAPSTPSATEPPASVAPSDSASPASSAAATAEPTTPPIPSFAIPSFTTDAELEARLPDAYQGVTLKKLSFKGTNIVDSTTQSGKQLSALLQSLGKTPADLSFAVATDPARKLGVTFGAYRIKGAAAASWAPLLYQIAEEQSPGTATTDVNLGGKDVKRITAPKVTLITYAWAEGDILFIVSTATDALAGPAIAVMP